MKLIQITDDLIKEHCKWEGLFHNTYLIWVPSVFSDKLSLSPAVCY